MPDDFVVATGETHSVRELCEVAFGAAGLNYEDHVVIDPAFIRPAEVDLLVGDATKAHEDLGWKCEVDFYGLIEMMVAADLDALRAVGRDEPLEGPSYSLRGAVVDGQRLSAAERCRPRVANLVAHRVGRRERRGQDESAATAGGTRSPSRAARVRCSGSTSRAATGDSCDVAWDGSVTRARSTTTSRSRRT